MTFLGQDVHHPNRVIDVRRLVRALPSLVNVLLAGKVNGLDQPHCSFSNFLARLRVSFELLGCVFL